MLDNTEYALRSLAILVWGLAALGAFATAVPRIFFGHRTEERDTLVAVLGLAALLFVGYSTNIVFLSTDTDVASALTALSICLSFYSVNMVYRYWKDKRS